MGYYNNYTQDMFAVVLRADRTKPLQISPGLSNGWCSGDIQSMQLLYYAFNQLDNMLR